MTSDFYGIKKYIWLQVREANEVSVAVMYGDPYMIANSLDDTQAALKP